MQLVKDILPAPLLIKILDKIATVKERGFGQVTIVIEKGRVRWIRATVSEQIDITN